MTQREAAFCRNQVRDLAREKRIGLGREQAAEDTAIRAKVVKDHKAKVRANLPVARAIRRDLHALQRRLAAFQKRVGVRLGMAYAESGAGRARRGEAYQIDQAAFSKALSGLDTKYQARRSAVNDLEREALRDLSLYVTDLQKNYLAGFERKLKAIR